MVFIGPIFDGAMGPQRTQYLKLFCVSGVVSISVVPLLTFGSNKRVLSLEEVGRYLKGII